MNLSVPARVGLAGLGSLVFGGWLLTLSWGDGMSLTLVVALLAVALAGYCVVFWLRMRRYVDAVERRRAAGAAPPAERPARPGAVALAGLVLAAAGVVLFLTDDDPTETMRRGLPAWVYDAGLVVCGVALVILAVRARRAAVRT